MIYNLGRVVPLFKGTYDAATTYTFLDVVFYDNSSFVALDTTTGNLPTDTTHWLPVALKGTTQDPTPAQMEQIISEVETYMEGNIVDNLNSTDTDKPLSANMGNELGNKSTIASFVGDGNNILNQYFYCLQGHKYRIYPSKTNVDFSGVSYTSSSYVLFNIRDLDFNKENPNAHFARTCTDKVSPLQSFYEFEAVQSGYLNIRLRATVGERVVFTIIDLTAEYKEDNQVKIQETKAISDIVESTLVPTITNSKRLQYQEVGKQISTCIVDSSVFKIRKYEIIPNKIYIFSGKYTNISGFIKPVCWTDENDVIIKVEEQLTWTETSTHTFIDEDIVAPSNAKYLYVNFQTAQSSYYNLKEYNPISSAELRNDIDEAVSDVEEINEVLEPHITYNVGRNLFNKNDLYTGYLINGGELQPNSNGVLSNKIYLIPNKQYTLQGIVAYGNHPWVFFGFFNSNNEFIGRFGVKVSASYATQTFTFKNSATNTNYLTIPQDYSYCRIQVKTNATSQNYDLIQIEEGNVAHAVEPYTETATLDIDNVVKYTEQSLSTEEKDIARNNIGAGVRKQIRLLSIGNSYSQDALSYVPYLMKNINPDVDITIGICMLSSSYLSQHYGNFNTSFATYTFYISQNGGSWEDKGKHSIKWALSNYTWDIVLLQQSSTYSYQSYDTYYQPFLDELISSISNYQTYPIKFGWLLTQSKPAQTNGGANYSDETIISHFNSIAANSQKVYEETLCDFVIPCGTAIQNARTISSIKALGAYANDSDNTSGNGYLCYSDGVHLQEGLGCHIEALTVICKLLELSGYDYMSVIGESTLINASLISDIDVPGAHGSAIGETAANVRIAEWCAVMACKNPYEITDMNVYTAITKLVMIKDYDSHITNTTTPYIITNVGGQQSLTLNAAEGYGITSVQVKMGETDITSEVYNTSTHQIVIPSVTDCVLIKARTATSSSTNPEQ